MSAGGIPGNEHALGELREILASGRGIAFVGAGASAGLYPLWGALIQRLADEAVGRGLASAEDRALWLDPKTKPQQAVRGIKGKLEEGVFAAVLREIFRPRAGTGDAYYTPLQGALLRLRLRGYVTTNYDPGLLEARLALRPDSRATGFGTWKDADVVHGWYTDAVFAEQPCPILFAHGIYERSETIVLGAGEYREAYRPGAYRRLFDKLWSQERLLFAGFGFSDAWLDFLAEDVLEQTAARHAAAPRHLALLGLREDQPYTPEMRRLFSDQYDAEVLFYPVGCTAAGGEDHGELLAILEALTAPAILRPSSGPGEATPAGRAAAAGSPPGAAGTGLAPGAPVRPPQRWTHETTEDDRYVGREAALRRLDRWAEDPGVRVIAVTGLGGLGKTSLIGRWLKIAGGAGRRPHRGLFFWSFYADRSVAAFLGALLEFAARELRVPLPQKGRPAALAAGLLRDVPLLLVLDGLEVLQERPGTTGYGALLDFDLREVLEAACRTGQPGLAVLTSRFPFADLTPYLGTGLRTLDLDRLSPAEGADLLLRCGVGGTAGDREEISRRLEGHPLGLRVFAATLAASADGDPGRLVQAVFETSGLKEDEPLERKLRHLLAFYAQALPPRRAAVLGLISLFRTPVGEETLHRLAGKLPAVRDVLSELSQEALRREIQGLAHEHLVQAELGASDPAYSCHPILRNHFRSALLAQDRAVAAEVADLLGDRPDATPRELSEIEPVLAAIELLLEAGDFERADELYRERLENGALFFWLPAFHEATRCALGFVGNEEAKRRCQQHLPTQRLGFYLNDVGLFALDAGEIGLAASFRAASVAHAHSTGEKENLSIALQNHSELLTRTGSLAEAEINAREALSLARDLEAELETCEALCSLGDVLAHQGRIPEARGVFMEANEIQKRLDSDGAELYSLRGIQWADLLLRIGQARRSRKLTEANLLICDRYGWAASIARCHLVLARLDLAEDQLAAAADHLDTTEPILRRGHLVTELPHLLLARADLGRRQRSWESALAAVEEALRIAAPRQMRPAHADALALRGRILLERVQAGSAAANPLDRAEVERAGDDAEAALALARQCGYAWAERDALALLAEVRQALGDTAGALGCHRDADALSARLRSPE